MITFYTMYHTLYSENRSGHADKQAVQTLSREVTRIITEQVKKSLSDNKESKPAEKK